ncbi:MAG: hypothetical protein WDA22_16345 [Bacteroidota bacterium]
MKASSYAFSDQSVEEQTTVQKYFALTEIARGEMRMILRNFNGSWMMQILSDRVRECIDIVVHFIVFETDSDCRCVQSFCFSSVVSFSRNYRLIFCDGRLKNLLLLLFNVVETTLAPSL